MTTLSSRLTTKAVAAALIATSFLVLSASQVLGAGLIPLQNPKSNVTPSPNYLQSATCSHSKGTWTCANPCVSAQTAQFLAYNNTSSCTTYVLQLINTARRSENVQPMVLPSNWYSLTPLQQLFVVADLERTARGLSPYLGINKALSLSAQQAALSLRDPNLASRFPIGHDAQQVPGMGSTWSSGFTVLEADFEWMYSDGWGGSRANTFNVLCTSPNAPACWGHRDELLGYDGKYNPGVGLNCKTCEMGTGFAVVRGESSFADLIELPASSPPAMTFTWAANVVPYLIHGPASSVPPTTTTTTTVFQSPTWAPETSTTQRPGPSNNR